MLQCSHYESTWLLYRLSRLYFQWNIYNNRERGPMLKKNHCNISCVMEETWKKKQFDKMCPENNLYNTELVPEAICEFCKGSVLHLELLVLWNEVCWSKGTLTELSALQALNGIRFFIPIYICDLPHASNLQPCSKAVFVSP